MLSNLIQDVVERLAAGRVRRHSDVHAVGVEVSGRREGSCGLLRLLLPGLGEANSILGRGHLLLLDQLLEYGGSLRHGRSSRSNLLRSVAHELGVHHAAHVHGGGRREVFGAHQHLLLHKQPRLVDVGLVRNEALVEAEGASVCGLREAASLPLLRRWTLVLVHLVRVN